MTNPIRSVAAAPINFSSSADVPRSAGQGPRSSTASIAGDTSIPSNAREGRSSPVGSARRMPRFQPGNSAAGSSVSLASVFAHATAPEANASVPPADMHATLIEVFDGFRQPAMASFVSLDSALEGIHHEVAAMLKWAENPLQDGVGSGSEKVSRAASQLHATDTGHSSSIDPVDDHQEVESAGTADGQPESALPESRSIARPAAGSVEGLVQPDAVAASAAAAGHPSTPSVAPASLVHRPSGMNNFQQEIADGLLAKYAEPLRESSSEAHSAALVEAFNEAAAAFNDVGCNNFADADRMLKNVLRRDTLVRSIVGGALMVGPGYTAGMWSMMRAVMPMLPDDMNPALKGFIGGLIVSSIDKIMSSGFMAVAIRNLYSGGPLKDNIPEVASKRPSLKKIAWTSGAVAGAGTFLKNLSLRGSVTQLLASGRKPIDQNIIALGDLAADTGGSFISGGLGRYISHRLLNGKHEAASFLVQKNVGDKIRAYNTPNPSESIGKAIVMNANAFINAAGKSTTLPSSYIAGVYCALLMSALMSTHDYITRKSGNPGGFEGKLATFEHTLASSGLMGALVSGAVTIGILGLMDQYRNRILAQVEETFKTALRKPQQADLESGTARIEEMAVPPSEPVPATALPTTEARTA